MMGGMADNTLSGQSFFLMISKGICGSAENGGCTVWGGNISIEHEDGLRAGPSTGRLLSCSFEHMEIALINTSRCIQPPSLDLRYE
jgi:hypothetical protein